MFAPTVSLKKFRLLNGFLLRPLHLVAPLFVFLCTLLRIKSPRNLFPTHCIQSPRVAYRGPPQPCRHWQPPFTPAFDDTVSKGKVPSKVPQATGAHHHFDRSLPFGGYMPDLLHQHGASPARKVCPVSSCTSLYLPPYSTCIMVQYRMTDSHSKVRQQWWRLNLEHPIWRPSIVSVQYRYPVVEILIHLVQSFNRVEAYRRYNTYSAACPCMIKPLLVPFYEEPSGLRTVTIFTVQYPWVPFFYPKRASEVDATESLAHVPYDSKMNTHKIVMSSRDKIKNGIILEHTHSSR